MEINVQLVNGLLPDQYGKFAPSENKIGRQPVTSFPITISDPPAGTKAFALTLVDHDSIPVCGFTWIHWIATNIPGDWQDIPENASLAFKDRFIQGKNSNASQFVNGQPQTGYIGPTPPDKTHDYQLTVFALDQILPLKNGYWLNEFLSAAKDHILDQATVTLPSRAN
ncbi:YbhB/YbcL family Raf kinase inhibitor-like protein [uncultured Limosilactobacillus sp.]|uniref:YbhB/YbcL family Raf kinase inhibitor-like protein n=1 Tax=uncultured Limosilactobacillus sp. TaxID=2837629 RepID=UPI0025CC522A|nr:YbhB/YbcL family Raf kinase inhibitor-like protein [uncultured Limosilactobacillus sp.]